MPYRLPLSPAAELARSLGPRPVIGAIVLSRGIGGAFVVTVYEQGTNRVLMETATDPTLWDDAMIPQLEALARGETLPTPPRAPDAVRRLRLEG